MKIKIRIFALLLAMLLAVLPLASCKDEEVPADGDTGINEEFTGSISGAATPSTTPSSPPLAEGDETKTITISSYEDLKSNIAQKGTFVLMQNIEIEAADFTPIGTYAYPFLGNFDGNGKTITVTVKQSDEGLGFSPTFKFIYCALFGVVRDATITNLTVNIKAAAVSTSNKCFVLSGGIAGHMINTNVTKCTIEGQISAKSEFNTAYSGGIAGYIQGGKIENCTVKASISSLESEKASYAGGISGYIFDGTEVSSCKVNSEAIEAVSTYGKAYAGGLVGNARHSAFTACQVDAPVTATVSKYSAEGETQGVAFAGGIAAAANGDSCKKRASFKDCFALKKNITVNGNKNLAYAGGFAGILKYGEFTSCFSLCDISLTTDINLAYAGSAFGLINSYRTQNADNTYTEDFIVKDCFTSGSVNAAHALVGTSYGDISNDAATENITALIYNNKSSYKVNGKETGVVKNGTEQDLSGFTINEDFKWEIENGVVKQK